jgi:hypothetical protein
MQKTGEFNGQCDPDREKSKKVVDCNRRRRCFFLLLADTDWVGNESSRIIKLALTVIKHAMTTVDLRIKLTDHTGEENHGQTGTKEDVSQPVGQSPKGLVMGCCTSHFNSVDNQNNHELTPQKVAIEVVTFMDEGSTLERVWMGVPVEIIIDWPETDNSSLASFHHCQPSDGDN